MLLFQYVLEIWVQKCLKCRKYGSQNAETAKNLHSEIKIKAQGETKNLNNKSHDSVYH